MKRDSRRVLIITNGCWISSVPEEIKNQPKQSYNCYNAKIRKSWFKHIKIRHVSCYAAEYPRLKAKYQELCFILREKKFSDACLQEILVEDMQWHIGSSFKLIKSPHFLWRKQ